MSVAVLFMSMSFDGFVAAPNETPANPLGDGGERLREWHFTFDASEYGVAAPQRHEALHRAILEHVPGVNRQIMDEIMATGSVVAGKGTAAPANYWDGNHHDGVPIFIVSRHEPPAETTHMPRITFIDDLAAAMSKAKRAAGDKDVLVHGAGVAQLALAAGVLDELEISVIPVLFGQGRRLFDNLAPDHIELERTRILHGEEGVTHLHYRVQHLA